MPSRRIGICVWVVCVGWGTLGAAEPAKPPTPAQRLWQQGQDAIRDGRSDEAVRLYQESLRLDPGLACNYLGLATAFLDKADDERAAPFMAQYLAAQPRHHLVRAQYAELLLRLGDVAGGLRELERFAADIQDDPDLARKHLIHCHSQLMEIAELAEDEYGAHLHHGIALYLLACQRALLPDDDDPNLSPESLLCKAAGELMQARMERPDEARPCWYLFEVWSRLAQNQPASRWLRAAEDAAPFSSLTPAERRDLHLACECRGPASRRK